MHGQHLSLQLSVECCFQAVVTTLIPKHLSKPFVKLLQWIHCSMRAARSFMAAIRYVFCRVSSSCAQTAVRAWPMMSICWTWVAAPCPNQFLYSHKIHAQLGIWLLLAMFWTCAVSFLLGVLIISISTRAPLSLRSCSWWTFCVR